MKKLWMVGLLTVLVAGCATQPGQNAPATQAVSKQAPTSEAQRSAKIHTELASLYFGNRQYSVALEELSMALAVDSGYAPAYGLQGLVHMALNENGRAEDNFQRALGLASGDPEIRNNYGWFLCQTGRERSAIPHFLAAAQNPLYTTPGRAYFNAGLCAVRLKDDRLAEEYFLRARAASAASPQLLYQLASLYLRKSLPLQAKPYVDSLNAMIEPTAESLWLSVRVFHALGDRNAAGSHASMLTGRFPDSPEAAKLRAGEWK